MARNSAVRKVSARDDVYNKYISGGTHAHSAAPRPRTEHVKRPKQGTGKNKKSRGKKRTALPQTSYKFELKNIKKLSFLTSLTVAAVFIGAFLCVSAVAYVDMKSLELSRAQDELKRVSIENIALQGEILDNYDLTEVERRALELGMVKPQESQIIYIDVPKVGYVVRYNTSTENETEFSSLASISSIVKGFLSYFDTSGTGRE